MVKDDRFSDNPHDRDAVDSIDGVAGVSGTDQLDEVDDLEALDGADEEGESDDEEGTVTVDTLTRTPWSTLAAPIDGLQPIDASSDNDLADMKPSPLARPLIAAAEALLSPPPVSNEVVTFPPDRAVVVAEDETEPGLSEEEAETVAAAIRGEAGQRRSAKAQAARAAVQVEEASEERSGEDDDEILGEAIAPAVGIVSGVAGGSRLPEKFTLSTPGGWWTIPTLCAGLAIIACGVILPQTDANRRLAYEKQSLERDFVSVTRQVEVNEQFLSRVADDPNLAERLAQRQMKMYRQGTAVLNVGHGTQARGGEMSPFQLTAVIPPEPLPPYRSKGGTLATVFLHPKHGLWASGLGLFLAATGLVMGGGTRVPVKEEEATKPATA